MSRLKHVEYIRRQIALDPELGVDEAWPNLRDRVCKFIDQQELDNPKFRLISIERVHDPHNPLRQGYIVWYRG